MSSEVCVISLSRRFRRFERSIENAAYFFLENLKKKDIYVEIYLVGNTKMRKLNNKHRGKDSSTNVLAFNFPSSFPAPETNQKNIGEIYLNPSYIKRNGEDIKYLLLHGILHLFDFNHENKSDRIKMEKIEEEIIAFLRERSER